MQPVQPPIDLVAKLQMLVPDRLRTQLVVAVSGGADSMALTLLAARAMPGQVQAVTVDHGLRAESRAEAEQVAEWLAAHAIPHRILPWEGAKPRSNIQAAARAARYALLEEAAADIGAQLILTAHHRDDQAETLLLRLGRGAGVAGLAAMPTVRRLQPGSDIRLVRPLLDVPRTALEAYLHAISQAWLNDPSNDDARYNRIRVRKWLRVPALPGLTSEGVAATSVALRDAHVALEHWTREKVAAHVFTSELGQVHLDDRALLGQWPFELSRRVLLLMLLAAGGSVYAPRRDDLQRLLHQIGTDPFTGATLAGALVLPRGMGLSCQREPRAVVHRLTLPIGDSKRVWDGRYVITLSQMTEGMRLECLGMAGWQLLRDRLKGRVAQRLALVQPGLWQGDRLVAAPTLGLMPEPPSSISVRFVGPIARIQH